MKDYLYIYGGKSSLYNPVSTEGMSGLTNGEWVYICDNTGNCETE